MNYTPEQILEYIARMKENAMNRMKLGKKPKYMFIYKDDCTFCHTQVSLFWKKGTAQKKFHDGLDVPIEILLYNEARLRRALAAGKISKRTLENKLTIIDNLIPVNKRAVLGERLVDESREWSRKTGNPNDFIDYTPTFIDFQTHQIVAVGYQAGRWLHNMMNDVKIKKRKSAFSKMYSALVGKACDEVSCSMKSHVGNFDESYMNKEG